MYSSSWFLVQHVQKTHGLKIYEEPRDVSPPPPPTSSVPTRPIIVQPDKILADQLHKDSPHASSPFHKGAGSRHQSPTCSPRTGGRDGGSDMFSSFPTPFMPGAPRQPSSGSSGSSWPYGRSPMVPEFAMMHPEMMMDQLRRLQGLVAGGGDHSAIPGLPPFLRPPTLDNQYSHSERLRLLAATGSTSPKHIPPRSKHDTSFTSPTQSTPPSAFSTPTTTTSVASHDTTNSLVTSASGGSRQLKQCEFCNKQFRFASNLVLHRRLHTGERPYSCPLCPFTSAQATKLRTHMRSHVTSPADTATAPAKLSDSDIEDTEEFVQREAEAEAAIRQLERDAKIHKELDSSTVDQSQGEDEPTDLSSNGGRHSVDSASPAPLTQDNENDEDIVTDRASLLSEVMMKTGLSSLPNYKEAFTAALAEAAKSPQNSSPKPHTPATKDDKADNGDVSPVKIEPQDKDESVHDYTDGEVDEELEESTVDDESRSVSSQRRSPQSHASSELSSSDQPPEKRIKRETSPAAPAITSSPTSTFPGADHLFQRAVEAAAGAHGLYPGLWPFPPTSSAGGLPFPPFMPRGGEHATAAAMMSAAAASSRLHAAAAATTSENGLSPQASSAFSNNGSPKLPSPDPSGLSGLTAQGKRRNDTCEFCGKVFKNCSNLTVHRRSHTGEKPYKCQLCPYACAQSSKLTRHMRTHGRHGKDVYRCKFCCMPFSVPSTLEKHMRKCVENQQRAAAAARHLASPLAPNPLAPMV